MAYPPSIHGLSMDDVLMAPDSLSTFFVFVFVEHRKIVTNEDLFIFFFFFILTFDKKERIKKNSKKKKKKR
jgi:uncharacterized membrane protein